MCDSGLSLDPQYRFPESATRDGAAVGPSQHTRWKKNIVKEV